MAEEENKTPSGTEEETPEAPNKELSGEYLWRVLKPAGCILVLLLFIAFLVMCFTYRTPV